MKNNETSVSVNAELNMSDVKKELDIFFNTTVKKVKTEVDSSKLINAIKDFKIKDLVPKIDISQIKASLAEIGPNIKQMGHDVSQWSMGKMVTGLQEATNWVKGLGSAFKDMPIEELSLPEIPKPTAVKIPVEMNTEEPAQTLEKSMGKTLGIIGAGVGAVGTGISKWAKLSFGNQFDAAKTAILDAGAALGTDLAPAITGVSDGVRDFSNTLTDAAATGGLDELLKVLPDALDTFLSSLPDYLTQLIEGVTSLLTGIGAALPEIIPPILDMAMQLLIELVANLPQLLEAGLQLIMGLATAIIESIPLLLEQLPVLIEGIISFILTSIPLIIQAGIQLFVALVQALPQIIETLVLAIPQIINGLVTAILNSIPELIQAGINLLVSLIQNLPDIIITLVAAIPQIIEGLVGAIVDNIDQIIMAGVQLFVALIENLPTIISEIVLAVPQIISALVDTFGQMISTIWNIGTDLVKGIFDGISNAIGWLREKLSGWVDDVIGYIKGLFGIHSPSKVMRDEVGKNLALGVAEGISKNTGAVSDAMSEMADVVTDSDLRIEPEVSAKSIDFEAFKEKIRPSLDFVKSQISRAQDAFNSQIAASLQLAGVAVGAAANNTYNNGNTFHNHYTINTTNNSPKATADAIKNQMTMQRMLFATR